MHSFLSKTTFPFPSASNLLKALQSERKCLFLYLHSATGHSHAPPPPLVPPLVPPFPPPLLPKLTFCPVAATFTCPFFFSGHLLNTGAGVGFFSSCNLDNLLASFRFLIRKFRRNSNSLSSSMSSSFKDA